MRARIDISRKAARYGWNTAMIRQMRCARHCLRRVLRGYAQRAIWRGLSVKAAACMSAFSDFWNDLLRLTHYEHTTTHPATDCRASSGAFYERNAAVSDVRIFGPRRPASEDVRRQEDARR